MKHKRITLIALCLMALLVITGCSNDTEDASATLDLGTVNGVPIDQKIFETYYALYANSYTEYYGDEILDTEIEEGKTLAQILNDDIKGMLINDMVIRMHMNDTGFFLEESAIEEELAFFYSELEANEEMKNLYEISGADEAFYREQVLANLYGNAFFMSISEQVEVEEAEELENMYKNTIVQVRARHILVESQEEALEIISNIEAGAIFSEMAEMYSIDTATGVDGGDLGYFPRNAMVPEFEAAAFSLQIGELSPPVQSDFGYHIILVEDRQTINDLIAQGNDEAEIEYFKGELRNNFINKHYIEALDRLYENYKVGDGG